MTRRRPTGSPFGIDQHFRKSTLVENANEVCENLKRYEVKVFRDPDAILEGSSNPSLHSLEAMGKEIGVQMAALGRGKAWNDADKRYLPGTVVEGTVVGVKEFGVFVELEPGLKGLLHRNSIPATDNGRRKFAVSERVHVRIFRVRTSQYKIDLDLAEGQ